VTAPPAASATIDANKTTGVAPLEVSFDGFPFGKPTDWLWEFGEGGKYAATQKTSYTYERPGKYTVKLTARNDYGVNDKSQEVEVQALPALAAAFTHDAAAPQPFGTPVNFTDASTGNPTHWLWEFGDGKYAVTQNATHTYDRPGTHTVKLTVRHDHGVNDKSEDVEIEEALKFDDVDARWMQWDRRCIMSYSRTAFGENEEYFCGKCILRNRGWKVRGIGHPGRNVKEP
jgi:PKD repeat protein